MTGISDSLTLKKLVDNNYTLIMIFSLNSPPQPTADAKNAYRSKCIFVLIQPLRNFFFKLIHNCRQHSAGSGYIFAARRPDSRNNSVSGKVIAERNHIIFFGFRQIHFRYCMVFYQIHTASNTR